MAGAEGPGLAAGGGCALRPFHSCCRRAKQRPVKASWPIGPVCRPSAAPVDFLDDSEQARQLRTCLNDTGMPLDLRVAAALVLVYGLTLTRIAYLTRDDITHSGGQTWLRHPGHRLLLPPRLAALPRPFARQPARHH
ncbi:MAG TPA: hypothetical protein DHU96_17950, partial [Actinobacteria bacterium]|nr:hypothetical protein [Actinomycetota bacterium]